MKKIKNLSQKNKGLGCVHKVVLQSTQVTVMVFAGWYYWCRQGAVTGVCRVVFQCTQGSVTVYTGWCYGVHRVVLWCYDASRVVLWCTQGSVTITQGGVSVHMVALQCTQSGVIEHTGWCYSVCRMV